MAVNTGDGQAFAALAMDPALRRPDVFYMGKGDASYRADRPLAGWLAWLLTAGRPGLVPYALGAVAVAGVGLLALAGAALARARQRDGRPLTLLLMFPGVVADLRWFGPDALGAGLALLGVVLWQRSDRRVVSAVVCFTLVGLTRETLLLVPFIVGLDSLRRRDPSRPLFALAIAPAVYVAWTMVVHARFGAWPTGWGQGGLAWPLAGLFAGLAQGGMTDVAVAAAVGILAVAALVRLRRGPEGEPLLRALVAGHLVLAMVLGPLTWPLAFHFGRVLLPLLVISTVACLPAAPAPAPRTSAETGRLQLTH